MLIVLAISMWSGLLLQEAVAQVPEESIYPGKTGTELIQALRADYAPSETMGYGVARDSLYRYLDTRDGVLIGAYGGYSVDIPEGQDPSSTAYQNGAGISAEHTWPQSKGAGSEPQKSDMHNLFPVKQTINSARGNAPYDDIPDADTDTWYVNDTSQPSTPTAGIDSYSERDGVFPGSPNYSSRFEPQEDHKGNAARAIFYYRVVHSSTISDPNFFEAQEEELLEWHSQDAIDQNEYDRSQWIAGRQGTNNPFVLDPTLADRAFGTASGSPSVTLANANVSVGEGDGSATLTVQINTPDGNAVGEAVDVDLVFNTEASTASLSDVGNYTTQTVSFSGTATDGTQQDVSIAITDDTEPEPLESARFALQNVSTTSSTVIGAPSAAEIAIEDNDGAASGDLIISQYVDTDSGTTPKGIELWNATGAEIDFSVEPLSVERYANGSSSATNEFTLDTGTLGAGEVLVIGGADLQTYMQANAPGVDFENDSFSFNGNDALEVTLGGTTTDVFGIIGSDPGDAWTGGGVSTKDSNIQLLGGITSGTTTGFTDPSTRFETAAPDPFNLTGFGQAPGGVNAPTVQFAAASGTVSEGDGSTDLTVSIANPDGTAVDVEIALSPGSIADASDIGDYTTQTVTFPASASDGATQTVPVTLTDDSEVEGDETASFTLQNLTTNGGAILGSPQAFDLAIEDNDASPLVINEILADPETGTAGDANGDGSRDASEDEFVEIYNTGSAALDLSGYTIEDGVGLRHTIPSGTTLDPGVALTVFGGGTPASSIPGVVQTASEGLLGLNNGGDTVTLKSASGGAVASLTSGGTIAEVTYGGEGSNDQSLVRSPEFTGPFVGHTTVSADAYSPGRQANGTPLPVELTGFTATRSGESVTLQWTTASETNNAGFEVQRAEGATDTAGTTDATDENVSWTTLAFVEGAGTTDQPQSYAFTADVPVGTHRFRLRQVDTGGTESFSEPVEVDVTLDKAYQLSQAYPNPMRSQATLDLTVQEAQPVTATVYDLLGRRVETVHRGNVAANTPTELRVSADGLSSGTYFVRVEGESFTATRRLTVVR